MMAKAKEPMMAWLKSIPHEDHEMLSQVTADDINQDCSVYLAPEFDDEEAVVTYLDSVKLELFDELLAEWTEDEKQWPQHRSIQLFDEWFYLEYHSVVFDLASEDELTYDDFE